MKKKLFQINDAIRARADQPTRPVWTRRRRRLVEDLRDKGIEDERVLAAIGRVPRHHFVADPALRHRAYHDEALPIGWQQTISQPYTVAYQTELLGLEPGLRVLEIGTGSGYQAAVLAEMDVQVFSIERHCALLDRTRALLDDHGYTAITTRCGDGTKGWPEQAPFDRIIVTAGAEDVPTPLVDQLRLGGYLVIPHRHGDAHQMLRLTKTSLGQIQTERLAGCRFVPLVPES